MSEDQLAARDESGVRVLSLSGEIDVVVAPGLQPELSTSMRDAAAVVLDLTEVTFFDSSALRLVDQLARECVRSGVPVRVVAPKGGPSRMVLDLVGMGAGLVENDLEAALQAVREAR